MATKSNFPHRKSVSVTNEMQDRITAVVDARSMTEPYILREILEAGLTALELLQNPDRQTS